jgi:hypothetical protein
MCFEKPNAHGKYQGKKLKIEMSTSSVLCTWAALLESFPCKADPNMAPYSEKGRGLTLLATKMDKKISFVLKKIYFKHGPRKWGQPHRCTACYWVPSTYLPS